MHESSPTALDPPPARGAAGRLVARLPNWVGDTAIILPVLEALGRAGFELFLVGPAHCAQLLDHLPATSVPTGGGHLAVARRLRRLETHRGVLFTRSIGSAVEMRLAGIRAVGYRAEMRRFLLHRSLAIRYEGHILDYYWRIARLACRVHGGDERVFDTTPPRPALRPAGRFREEAEAALAAAGLEPPFQAWIPLAANTIRGASKVWPGYADLCRRATAAGIRVACCPGPGEEEAARAALPGATLLQGLSLGTMAAVLERADLALGNDTGPVHVAAALGVPTIALFGPGGNPDRTCPIGGIALGGADGWPTADRIFAELIERAAPAAPPPEGQR